MIGGTYAAVAIAAESAPVTARVERLRPTTLVRAGDAFSCPDIGDVAIVQSGTLLVELVTAHGTTLRLARLQTGDVAPSLDTLATPAFVAGYRAERSTQIMWRRGDGADVETQMRAIRARDALLGACMRQLSLLACLSAPHRLYVELLRAAAASGSATFDLPSHGELATRVSTTRETVSREISLLRREGVLSADKPNRLIAPRDLVMRLARALNLASEAEAWESIGIDPASIG